MFQSTGLSECLATDATDAILEMSRQKEGKICNNVSAKSLIYWGAYYWQITCTQNSIAKIRTSLTLMVSKFLGKIFAANSVAEKQQ